MEAWATKHRTPLLLTAALLLLWGVGVFLTSRIGITLRTDAGLYELEHYLPFGVVWLGVTVLTPVLLGSYFERLGWRGWLVVSALVLAVALFFALYYVIGRPIEFERLSNPSPAQAWPTQEKLATEAAIPIGVGLGLATLYALGYWFMRHVMESSRGPLRSLRTGVVLYFVTGLLFWLHAGVSWLIVRIVADVPPHAVRWVRFIDDLGPSYIFSHVFLWPAMVVTCCG